MAEELPEIAELFYHNTWKQGVLTTLRKGQILA